MLDEAIDLVRMLWRGGVQSRQGRYFTVQDARIYDLPAKPVPICIAAGGSEAASLAARAGDGLIATEPKAELVEEYTKAGGSGLRYAQIALCWGEDEAGARTLARELWRFGVPGWKVMSELPSPVNFDAATQTVREDDIAELVPCGPDVDKHVEGIKQFVNAGFDHIAVVQVGPDQAGFLRFWQDELAPALVNL
jgi:G6PDH family F420-dependent oxidoreductase